MTTRTRSTKTKENAGKPPPQQRQMEGDGFPDPLPKELQIAVGRYITAKREAADASEAKGQAMQKVIELGHKHGLERIPIEGENKFIELGKKDTCKVKTKPKAQEDARIAGVAGGKPVFEKD